MKKTNTLDNLKKISAQDYLKIYNANSNYVDIEKIIKDNNIKLREINFDRFINKEFLEISKNFIEKYNLKNLWGLILEDNDDLYILYNNKFDEENRLINNKEFFKQKRFVLAHMFSHCILHPEYLRMNGSYIEYINDIHLEWIEDEYTKREIQANLYAQQLLIPEDSLKYVLKKLLFPSLKFISNCFDVPDTVARNRLMNMHITFLEDTKSNN